MPSAMPPRPPILTLLSDFGTRDFYVSAMKGVLLQHCPQANLVDITHDIPRHDVLCGSILLERAIDSFPADTVHLAVVDPGVGTRRRILVTKIYQQIVVCPDNGLITWAWRRFKGAKAHELVWRPSRASHTFHGRDIIASAVGMIASGCELSELARRIHDPVLLDIRPARNFSQVRIIHIDHFGNATSNLSAEMMSRRAIRRVRVKDVDLGRPRKTYADVPPGRALVLVGSSGLLEIAVREGSAAEQLSLRVGDAVQIRS